MSHATTPENTTQLEHLNHTIEFHGPETDAPESPNSGESELESHTHRQPTTLGQTNTYAMLSIVLAFVQPIAAIVFGHLGLNQIRKHGDAGRGLALTGTILGYVFTFGALLLIVLYVGFFIFVGIMASVSSGMEMGPEFYER